MKVIIYQDQKKITIGNIASPELALLKEQLEYDPLSSTSTDLDIYNFKVTSTQSLAEKESIINKKVTGEEKEGIKWQQETIN